MSTTDQPPQGQPSQGQPAPPNPDQTRDLLQFLREENEANRTAVRDDAEKNRKLLLDTIKIASVAISLIVLVAAFFGLKSISDVKDAIRTEAGRETQSEITRMQGEIRKRLDDQFQTPALQKLIKDAAKEVTEKSAEPLIKSEVAAQVKSGVDAQKPAIAAAVAQQTQAAVKQMESEIESIAKKSVDTKVSTEVDPVIRKIKDDGDFQLLITRMDADDAQAFDRLAHLPPSTDPSRQSVAIAALRSVYAAHNSGMFQGHQFSSPQTDSQLVAHLTNVDPFSRQAALDALTSKKNLSLLPRVVEMMIADPSIDVRCAAFRAFNNWTAQTFQCLDSNAFSWWLANKQKFQ